MNDVSYNGQMMSSMSQNITETKECNVSVVQKPKNMYEEKVKENFHVFGVASFLYACLYAFCMYRNHSGVTYSFFVAGSLGFIYFCLSKLGISWKKGSRFYMISMMLLSVSTFCTDDGRIIFFNKTGIFLLTICLLLSTIYNTSQWNLGKYLGSIYMTCMLAIGEIGSPFIDAAWYCKNKLDKKNSKYLYVLIGVAITIPLFLIVFLLLTSADAVFRDMADRLFSGLDLGDLFLIALMIGFMFLASYCLLAFLCKKTLKEEVKNSRKGEPLIAIPIASIMSLLYLVFSGVQIVYLFIGKMQLPEGYTYAEYAREGFFQLLAVSILNLIMVLIGLYYFKESKVLKAVLTVMSLCTFIMIASSAMRMIIYIQYYYLTFLRILVLWGLAVLFLIFSGVIAYIFKENFPLFRYSMVIVTCLYIVLSFSHPDYLIAKVNIAGSQETRSSFFKGREYDDFYFLSRLNADAAPVMLDWMEDSGCDLKYYYLADEAAENYYRELETGFDSSYGKEETDEYMYAYRYLEHLQECVGDIRLRNFNVSRYVAESIIDWKTKRGI